MRPKKANFRLSDGVHKPDKTGWRRGLRHLRLVKATSLVQTVGSANPQIPQSGTPGSTVYGTNCGFGFSTTTLGYVSDCSCSKPHTAAVPVFVTQFQKSPACAAHACPTCHVNTKIKTLAATPEIVNLFFRTKVKFAPIFHNLVSL